MANLITAKSQSIVRTYDPATKSTVVKADTPYFQEVLGVRAVWREA